MKNSQFLYIGNQRNLFYNCKNCAENNHHDKTLCGSWYHYVFFGEKTWEEMICAPFEWKLKNNNQSFLHFPSAAKTHEVPEKGCCFSLSAKARCEVMTQGRRWYVVGIFTCGEMNCGCKPLKCRRLFVQQLIPEIGLILSSDGQLFWEALMTDL